MSDDKSGMGRTPWDLTWELVRGLSWSRVLSVLITALLLLPILKLYVAFVPEVFPRGILRQTEAGFATERYSFLLPSNALWVDSGIVVGNSDTVKVQVSGSVNLAAHRLTWSSLADTRLSMKWIVYPGQPANSAGIDPERANGRLFDGAPLGAVVMYVCEGEGCPTAEHPRPRATDRVFSVVTESLSKPRMFAPVDQSGRLYFSVNDVVPDQEPFFTGREDYDELADDLADMHKRFVNGSGLEISHENVRMVGQFYGRWFGWAPPRSVEIEERVARRWERLQKDPKTLHRLFYDDNAGAYLVSVEVTRNAAS